LSSPDFTLATVTIAERFFSLTAVGDSLSYYLIAKIYIFSGLGVKFIGENSLGLTQRGLIVGVFSLEKSGTLICFK
jgi:hypothetical protein